MDGAWSGTGDGRDGWLEYDVVDVFSDRAFAGNPLAVVHGTAGLGTRRLAALAQEFNLSETAFPTVLAPSGPADYDLRIRTPQHELPFAGHPSIGAAWALRARGLLPVDRRVLRQRCPAGVVSVELGAAPADLVWLTGGPPAATRRADADEALGVVGLTSQDLAHPQMLITGAGLDFGLLLVRPDAVRRSVLDVPALRRLRAARPGVEGLVVAAWQAGAATVRVFTDDVPGAEDPATGSAALALGVVLVRAGLVAPHGRTAFTIAQGAGLGRPSVLHVRVTADTGSAVRVQVGGGVSLVARGRIRRPSQD